MATKPTVKPNFAISGVRVIPDSSHQTNGWAYREKPPYEYLNWLFENYYRWIDWFDQEVDANAADIASNLAYLQKLYTAGGGTWPPADTDDFFDHVRNGLSPTEYIRGMMPSYLDERGILIGYGLGVRGTTLQKPFVERQNFGAAMYVLNSARTNYEYVSAGGIVPSDVGALSPGTPKWLYVFILMSVRGGSGASESGVYVDDSISAVNLQADTNIPANLRSGNYRRVGAIRLFDVASVWEITEFKHSYDGYTIWQNGGFLDGSSVSVTSTPTALGLTVPPGRSVKALVTATAMGGSGPWRVALADGLTNGGGGGRRFGELTNNYSSLQAELWTDTSSQIYHVEELGVGATMNLWTCGWFDQRN